MIKVKEKNGKQYIYQYDTGREVIITPEEGYTVDSIEYFNNTTDLAPIGIIREVDGVLLSYIPNSFLQSENTIQVYLVMHDKEERQTIEYKDITVIPRVKPADYALEPDDVLTWHSLDERLKILEEGGTDGGMNKEQLQEAVNTALTQAKESGAFDGTNGTTPHIGTNGNWFIGESDTGNPSRGEKGDTGEQGPQGIQGEKGATGADGKNGSDGQDGEDGADGITPHIGENGNWFIGDEDTGVSATGETTSITVDDKLNKESTNPIQNKTVAEAVDRLSEQIVDHEDDTTKHISSAERTKWNKNTTDIVAPNEALANMQGRVVDSVEEMTDTSKQYVLKSTGTIWEYKETTVSGTVREACDDGYTYLENSRLGSDGSVLTSGSYAGYTITPFIDLSAYPFPYTLHLDGAKFVSDASDSYTRVYGYDDSQAKVIGGNAILGQLDSYITFADANVTQDSNGNTEIIVHSMPTAQGGAYIRYVRLSGKTFGTPSVYVTYEGETTTAQWVDTGVPFGSGGGIDTETLTKILELNNEGVDPATIKLLAQPVLDFYNASAYSDSDYTTSHLEKITYPCRADIPVPYTVKWNHNEEAMRTTLVLDTKAIGTVNNYRMRIYDVTGFDNYPLHNLLPNTRYYYKVTHVMADGSLVEAKNGNFLTSSETIRLLHIDGTQNVRDLGGWTGLNGKKVKYGKLIRGAALSDSSFNGLIVTGKGRLSLGELKIQAELNLGAVDTETSIAANCSYYKVGYNNYATAITDATARANFKTVLEKIVSWLSESTPRNVYFHCQGGCDRTGTLSFQLLGLLGVSESDLAKEYELSSFSDIGFGRRRNTRKAVNGYDYAGMVEALKTYSGSTITDKFYNFAIACGVTAETITEFRNLMLE